MKKISVFLISLVIYLSAWAQPADEQIGNYLNSSDFFMLEKTYEQLKNDIQTPMLKSLSETLLSTVFGNTDKAVEAIDSLIANHQGEIGLDNVRNMINWQTFLLFRDGRYQDSYDRINSFIEQLKPHVDSEYLSGSESCLRFYKAYLNEAAHELIRPEEDCIIPLEIDTIKIKSKSDNIDRISTLMYVPATVNGEQVRFIFDTGCPGGAFMSEAYAERLGVKVRLDSLAINGVGGTSFGKMGILDSIRIGNMVFRNLTVVIAPPNPQIDSVFQVNAVLGLDIMRHAGEVQILPQEKKIIFPIKKTSLPSSGRNMMRIANGDSFYLKAFSENERLIMLFDTGDSYSSLSKKYYEKHKDRIEAMGTAGKKQIGGFGGINDMKYYNLPSFPLALGNKTINIKDLIVEVDRDITFEDGSLGMAFINQCKKMIINFDEMFVKIE